MSAPLEVQMTPGEAAAKYNARRALISILGLISGTVLVTVSAGLLFGALYSLLILGVIFIVAAILIGYK